jgi:hypothetical protein
LIGINLHVNSDHWGRIPGFESQKFQAIDYLVFERVHRTALVTDAKSHPPPNLKNLLNKNGSIHGPTTP